MAEGLQVFNAAGALVFDASTNLTRLITSIGVGTSDGAVAIPSVNNFIVAWPTRYTGGIPPTVTVSGTTVSWTFGNAPVDKRSGCVILVMGY